VIDRRTFIGTVAGCLVVVRSVVEAQPVGTIYRIGFLQGATAESATPLLSALTEGLRDLGFVEGRNIAFERRYAGGRLERLPELAAELVRLRVDVIVTGSNQHVAAVQRATATIPIVFVATSDPVAAGFVASLARPGGNITGLTAVASGETLNKNLALLKEVVPKLSHVGLLGLPIAQDSFAGLEAAARKLNVALEVVDIRSPDDFEGAFATMVGKRVGAVIVGGGPLPYQRRQQIADWALKHRLPAIQILKEYAHAGLLMTYGPNLPDLYRRAASHVAKILGGPKPGDLPVEQPTKFELVINLKTAKAIGVTIPKDVLLRADEVIQ
jgi:putative tryptophan/tyrosine transport system substrate-binding protein